MTTADGSLRSPYRAIRAVRARDDGPWPGTLVRTAGGDAWVLVDAAVLGPQWRGWEAAPDGHVLAPVDVVRRLDGHDVVLPVCPERLEDFVRRRAARMPLSLGEAVTLGVSVLRGCAQIANEPEAAGDWWLDDAGRPVLATDASARRAFEASAGVLEQVSVDPPAQRTWQTALRAVTAERISVHELEAVEEALFALADAEPLSAVSLGPRSATEAVARAHEETRVAGVPHEPAPRSMWQTLVAGVDDELADSVSRATTALWRRLRRTGDGAKTGSRRAPWLVGGAVAAAVLAGGALWPTASGVATDDRASAAPTASPEPAASVPAASAPPATSAGGAPAGESADLARITGELLDARNACAGDDDACLTDVTVDAMPLAGGAIDLPAAGRSVTPLDDFGDIAVLRVDASDAAVPSQMVVILRTDQKWLLRDVSDVAQQP
ncbi:hypothetical protein MRBLWH7_000815 [Microbacterium sp. LWH7-1.2]|uniref:hypothetical protein n=1 Tax=Microbacterium sp. LWH7-1.2 TaxID=3135257 RepID=UPI003139A7DE